MICDLGWADLIDIRKLINLGPTRNRIKAETKCRTGTRNSLLTYLLIYSMEQSPT